MAVNGFIQVIVPLRLDWEPFYTLPEGMEARVGDRVRVRFAGREYPAVVSAVGTVPPEGMKKILPIEGKEEGLAPISEKELRFWREIADYYLCTPGEVFKAAYPFEKKAVEARKKAAKELPEGKRINLTPVQEEAANAVRKAFADGKTALLKGVTGSGKTEIYMELAKEQLDKGKQVLYLVPEIALSRQLEERIAAVFPDVLLYHSGITPARRRAVATALRQEGKPSLVLGTRSAIFLPFSNLGLVIVDEEHDGSYKQDAPAPRYNARESAIMLAGIHGGKVLLGSATPSLESLFNAKSGKYALVQLNERFYAGEESEVMIIDIVAERRKKGMEGSFSRKLISEMNRTLSEGNQILLLRSRRSYSPAVQCTECGSIVKCPHCNVSLSLHKEPERLLCHYCGHSEKYSRVCPKCGAALQPLGSGTQKVEEELASLFPEARTARLDSDNPSVEIIKGFASGDIDILVGTQIITKGFDFEKLKLVAVIQADNLLGLQDFRCDERALQILEQFRGRSGRRGAPGKLIIQTREPSHPVFSGMDNAPTMLEERSRFGYPPYSRLIHLIIKDRSEARAKYMSSELTRTLSSIPGLSGHIVGPYTPAIDKIADQYIRQIRIMLPRNKMLQGNKKAIYNAMNAFEQSLKYFGHIVIDVDPL